VRILFASVESIGRVFPLLPLADAARRAGHDVLFGTGEAVFDVLHRAGIATTRIGTSPMEALERAKAAGLAPTGPEAENMQEIGALVFGELVPRMVYEATTSVIEEFRPDLVIYEVGNTGALLAAQRHDIPVYAHTWGRVARTPIIIEVIDRTEKVAAELGVSGIAPQIDICPESAQSATYMAKFERHPMRPVGWTFPGDEVPPLVANRERPLVYVTVSSVLHSVPERTLLDLVQGIARLPVDVLMTTAALTADLPGLPSNVHVEPWVPQSLVVPHTELVVHHGGPGVMLNAMSAGVPQLVLPDPQGLEPGTSTAVLESGAGAVLPQTEITPDTVYEKVESLMRDESVRSAAASVAREIAAMPLPAEMVELLTQR
jgi:UDP:flavonoid glycosyltransferase YjiC (YdhE family)